MTIFRFGLIALASLLVGCAPESTANRRSPAEGNVLIMGVTLGGAPYTYRDEISGEIVGIDIDLAKAGAAKLGLELKIVPMEFQNLLSGVKSGELDLAGAAITITPNRARDVDFTESYASDGCAFLYRTGSIRPTMTNGSQLRIATQESSSSQTYLCAHKLDPLIYPTYEDCYEAFVSGEVETVFYDAAAIRDTVAKSGGTLSISPLETRERYGLAVRKDFPVLKRAIDEATREWRASR